MRKRERSHVNIFVANLQFPGGTISCTRGPSKCTKMQIGGLTIPANPATIAIV